MMQDVFTAIMDAMQHLLTVRDMVENHLRPLAPLSDPSLPTSLPSGERRLESPFSTREKGGDEGSNGRAAPERGAGAPWFVWGCDRGGARMHAKSPALASRCGVRLRLVCRRDRRNAEQGPAFG